MYRANAVWAALLAGFIAGAQADCDCYGLDYTNGGSYLIDGYSENKFSFTSQFEGSCFDADIVPILISPEGYGYVCSAVRAGLDQVEQVSTWSVPPPLDLMFCTTNMPPARSHTRT
jgi:hypothetical protein